MYARWALPCRWSRGSPPTVLGPSYFSGPPTALGALATGAGAHPAVTAREILGALPADAAGAPPGATGACSAAPANATISKDGALLGGIVHCMAAAAVRFMERAWRHRSWLQHRQCSLSCGNSGCRFAKPERRQARSPSSPRSLRLSWAPSATPLRRTHASASERVRAGIFCSPFSFLRLWFSASVFFLRLRSLAGYRCGRGF